MGSEQKEEGTKRKRRIFVLGLLVAAFLAGGFTFYALLPKEETGVLTLYGNIDIREVDLGFRVFGKVEKLFFDEGDRVQPGDLLATLDPTVYDEQRNEAKAQLSYAEISLANARKQWARRDKAIKSSAVSEEDFENAACSMKEMEANVEEARASLANATTSCEDTRLLAPCSGTILSRIREPGSVLNAGQPVFTLALDAPIWARVFISEPDLGLVYPGMEAEVYTDTKTSPVYLGTIGFISPVAEFTPKNVETTDLRTELVYRIRVIIDKPDERLRQGMPVTVKIKMKPKAS